WQVGKLDGLAVEIAVAGDDGTVVGQERDAGLAMDLVEAADVRQVVGEPAEEAQAGQRPPAAEQQAPAQQRPGPVPALGAPPRRLCRFAGLAGHQRLSRRPTASRPRAAAAEFTNPPNVQNNLTPDAYAPLSGSRFAGKGENKGMDPISNEKHRWMEGPSASSGLQEQNTNIRSRCQAASGSGIAAGHARRH